MRKIELSDKQLKELNFAESQLKVPQLSKRIQCIKLKNEGRIHEKIGKFLGVSIEAVRVRIKKYTEGGVMTLLNWDYKGKIPVLSLNQLEILRKRNKEKPFETAKECKCFIEKNFGFEYHLHSVQKILKKNFTYLSRNRR